MLKSGTSKPVIVGVDPGTTVGIAFLDVNGNVLGVHSSKNPSINDVVAEIREKGDLLILASDKKPLPEAVRRIAASFGSRVYTPPQSLSVEEKKALTRGYDTANTHEADALAAALKAYNAFSAKLRQIKRQEGADFEKRVKQRLAGERPEAEVVEVEKTVYVEKPVESYEKRLEKMRNATGRSEREIETLRELLRMKDLRIRELESRSPGGEKDYLESMLARAAAEKRGLEEKLDNVLSAYRAGKLEVLDMRDRSKVLSDVKDVVGERYTEDKDVFEWCLKRNHQCTLIRIIHIAEPYVYYHTIRAHTGESVKLDKIVDEYRTGRGQSYFK